MMTGMRGYAPFMVLRCTEQGVTCHALGLLALMAVLAQALLALVRSHLVALLLFSVWHNERILMVNYLFVDLLLVLYHLGDEALAGFEGRQVVGLNNQRCVLRDVACCFLGTVLDDEASESAQVDVFLVDSQAGADFVHQGLDGSGHFRLSDACPLCDRVDNFCLSHNVFLLVFYDCF